MIKLLDLLKEGRYDDTTFKVERRKLNVPLLIKKGAIFVTYAHGEDGWEVDVEKFPNAEEDWMYSLLSYVNVKDGDSWMKEASKYKKPKSYKHAEESINTSKPNLGNNELIYDGKYYQIIDSIKLLNIGEEAFL